MPASGLPGSRKFRFLLAEIISFLEAHRVARTEEPPLPVTAPRTAASANRRRTSAK